MAGFNDDRLSHNVSDNNGSIWTPNKWKPGPENGVYLNPNGEGKSKNLVSVEKAHELLAMQAKSHAEAYEKPVEPTEFDRLRNYGSNLSTMRGITTGKLPADTGFVDLRKAA